MASLFHHEVYYATWPGQVTTFWPRAANGAKVPLGVEQLLRSTCAAFSPGHCGGAIRTRTLDATDDLSNPLLAASLNAADRARVEQAAAAYNAKTPGCEQYGTVGSLPSEDDICQSPDNTNCAMKEPMGREIMLCRCSNGLKWNHQTLDPSVGYRRGSCRGGFARPLEDEGSQFTSRGL